MSAVNLSFRGGDRMASYLQGLASALGGATGVKVGFLEGATYPDGTKVAQVAFWNEFGTSRAPPRPFFRGMIAHDSPEWGDRLGRALSHYHYDSEQALRAVGVSIKDGLVKSIVDLTEPPLAPSTIKRKGFDKPLIDTGVMQRAADLEVIKR